MSEGRVVWVNDRFVPESEAKVSIYDSALMFGDMVFEMTRSFAGRQFELRAHLERLYHSMKYVSIVPPMDLAEMEGLVMKVIEKNQPAFAADDEHRIMINVSRGLLGIYQGVVGHQTGATLIIADFPLRWTVRGMGRLFDVGINMVITSQRAIPGILLDPKVKNRSRLHYMMANIEASNHKGTDNWALLLDPDGYVAEGTGDNFFIVRDGAVISPEPRNILRGISRDFVIKLCGELDIPFIESNIEPYDVHCADEAFITGTPFCMLPVTRLDHVPIGTGKVGHVFSRLLATWSDRVGVDICGQIVAWDSTGQEQVDGPTPYSFRRGSDPN